MLNPAVKPTVPLALKLEISEILFAVKLI